MGKDIDIMVRHIMYEASFNLTNDDQNYCSNVAFMYSEGYDRALMPRLLSKST